MTSNTGKINVCVVGAMGRMGQKVCSAIIQDDVLNLSGAVEYDGHPNLNTDLGTLIGLKPCGINLTSDFFNVLAATDLVIEFVGGAALDNILAILMKYIWESSRKIGVLSASTGLTEETYINIEQLSRKVPVLYAANLSQGMNIMLELTETASSALGTNFDAEIVETQHSRKKDAPSGTAMRLGEVIANARKQDLTAVGVYNRVGIDIKREKGQIGFSAVRGGDIIGEHKVMFFGDSEYLEITHKSFDRSIFVNGAMLGAKWVINQEPGFYRMRDALIS